MIESAKEQEDVMTHIPVLVTDMALILIIAGITTLICKKLKQPVIIGYVLAGF